MFHDLIRIITTTHLPLSTGRIGTEGSSAGLFKAFSCAVVMLQRLGGRQLFAIDVTEARMISFSSPSLVIYIRN